MNEEKIIEIIKEKIEYNRSEVCEYPDVEFTTALEKLLELYNKQERELKIKNEYLQLIHDIAFDYDGFNTVESLKELIDELVDLVNKAYKNDDKSVIYEGGNNGYNILHELIEGEEEKQFYD